MIRHHAKGIVGLIAQLGTVASARHFLQGADDRHKQVRIVVAVLILHHRRDAFEPGAGIHMLRPQRQQGAIRLTVELDEDQVPQLDETGAAPIHRATVTGNVFHVTSIRPQVDVNLATGSTGTRRAHLPEIFLLAAAQHAIRRKGSHPGPERFGLLGRGGPILCIAGKYRGPQAVGVEAIHLGEELPGPFDGLCLEVVAEGPIPQHLEKGMVVGINAHLFQIVVLAADPDALLTVHHPLAVGWPKAQEDVLELIHARVGEHQRVVSHGDDGRTGDEGVVYLLEEVYKSGSNLLCREHGSSRIKSRPSRPSRASRASRPSRARLHRWPCRPSLLRSLFSPRSCLSTHPPIPDSL